MDKLRIACFISTLTLLAACDDDSSSTHSNTGTEDTPTTSFSVSVDAPSQLLNNANSQASTSFGLFSLAYADAVNDLTRDNFAVAVIGPDGNVIETVKLTSDNWQQESDGTYVITLPGGERLDCVVLVSLDDGTPAVQLGEQLPSDVLLAPTTSNQLQVDLNSSVAYQAILKEITSVDGWGDYAGAVGSSPTDVESADDLVSKLIANVAENVDSLVNSLGDLNFTVATILQTPEIQELATNVVERIQTERQMVTTNTATALENGIWWLWADKWDGNNTALVELEAGNISFSNGVTTENIYEWDSYSEDAIELTEADMTSTQSLDAIDTDGMEIDSWVLTQDSDEAWQAAYDMLVFRSADQNKAVFADIGLHQDPSLDHQFSLKEIDLFGKKVAPFLSYSHTQAYLPYLPDGLKFPQGAKGYKIEEQASTEARYELWHDDDCDVPLNGNCNQAWLNLDAEAPTELSAITTETASDGQQINDIQGVWLSRNTLAELVNDASKTLVLWYRTAGDNFVKSHTDTWQATTVHGQTLYQFTVPEELAGADNDFDEDERQVFFAVQNGYVRKGAIKSSVDTDDEILLNQVAIDTIYNNASVDNLPQFERCTEGDKAASASEADFLQSLATCGYLAADAYVGLFHNMNLLRVNGSGGTHAYQFNEGGTLEYFKDGLQRTPRQWELDNGLIRISYGDNDPSYELLALTQVDIDSSSYAFKVYTHDAYPGEPLVDEIWSYVAKIHNPQVSVNTCTLDDSDYDDANEVPFEGHEKTMDNFNAAVAACMTYPADNRKALFTNEGLQNRAWQAIDEETEYLMYFDTDGDNDGWFDGLYRNVDPNDTEEVSFEWQIVNGQLELNAEIDGIDLTEHSTIVATNGIEFSVKLFTWQSNWVTDFDYMDETEGEIWSEAYRVIEHDDVPALPQ
ncbi:hypothetical protein VV869_12030 [Photobacterium sp. MCCC 1A19761]|uniref:hypothetical protein n=1 Tax=Photobacterium sp. MCCC 1A19761 TaxID=3115000 RepID=UPI00307E3000